jgi:hypothetical protein
VIPLYQINYPLALKKKEKEIYGTTQEKVSFPILTFNVILGSYFVFGSFVGSFLSLPLLPSPQWPGKKTHKLVRIPRHCRHITNIHTPTYMHTYINHVH